MTSGAKSKKTDAPPKRKRHRLRKLLVLAAAVGGAISYRNQRLGNSDRGSRR